METSETFWTRTQDRLMDLLGEAAEARVSIVATMLKRDPRETTAYWLQLGVAIGIATLGLVVGSTAVVIGAMLVAPLMGPIERLAMGLSAGSPLLVIKSAARIVLSVAASASELETSTLPLEQACCF